MSANNRMVAFLANTRVWLDVAAKVFTIVACVAVLWLALSIRQSMASARTTVPKETAQLDRHSADQVPISLENAAIEGASGARVGLVEFADFECPYCRRFARETLPQLTAQYVDKGKAFIAFMNYPLDAIHKSARRAAEVAECAREQGQFWKVHNFLFAGERLPTMDVNTFNGISGLDASALKGCLATSADAKINRDLSDARTLGLRGTPSFLIGILQKDGKLHVLRRASGAIPFESMASMLDQAIAVADGRAGVH